MVFHQRGSREPGFPQPGTTIIEGGIVMNLRNILICVALALAIVLILPLTISAAPLEQPKIPHTLDGRSACTGCHTVGAAGVGAPGGTGLPADHQGRTDAICQGCHQAAAASAAPAQPSPKPEAKPEAAPKPAAPAAAPAAAPTAAPAAPAQATAAPKPAASPTAPAAALPKTGEGPSASLLALAAMVLVGLGWGVRRLVATR